MRDRSIDSVRDLIPDRPDDGWGRVYPTTGITDGNGRVIRRVTDPPEMQQSDESVPTGLLAIVALVIGVILFGR